MGDSLSKQYLLYLRDMSRKVVYGASGSAGDYSQVLIRGSKQKNGRKFQRMTDVKLEKMINNPQGFKKQQDQENIGNGIFCGVGIISGTFSKKVRGQKTLRLISAPAIYGQISFEDEDENDYEISEWIVNYDIASALITRNATEEDEAYAAFVDEEDDKTGNKIVDEIENVLDKNPNPSINLLDELSMKFIEGFSKLIETDFEIVDKPLDCLSLGIEARENKIRKFFFCPGDWIFFAPIPEGLSTYQALNDLSKEI
tara:strand:+ start:302 stop:1069 length:768 start_codon:yes stop_codon:yes gene_type:complete